LLLILPWRPAYTLLGFAGIVAAMVIAILTPNVAPEPHPPSAKLALGERGEGDAARRFGALQPFQAARSARRPRRR